ncbi:MAG: ATP-binding protein [Ktedonobacterales bacterium]
MSVETHPPQHQTDQSVPGIHTGAGATPSAQATDGRAPRAPASAATPPHRPSRTDAWLAPLLALPLFYKVLAANAAIVLLGAVVGTAITWQLASVHINTPLDVPLAFCFAIAGILLSCGLNALVLRAALSPLNRLQLVVESVQAGDLSVRAHPSPLDDAQITRLAETLNQTLDEVERYEGQVRALSGGMIHAQEEERQRIARELHDDTGQVLTLLLIRLKLLEAQPGAEAIADQIGELRALVSSAIDQVRRLALNLRPPTIDQLGLLPSLRSLVTTFAENTQIEVKLDLPRGAAIHLSPEHTIAVYRVVQEALTNVAKHANAQRVTISVEAVGQELLVTIRDDGRGFTPEAAPGHSVRKGESVAGVGLFGMEERARLAGGSLKIQSAPGLGTAVTLRAPRDERPQAASSAAEPMDEWEA